jgi:hypothetical protein
MESHKNIPMIKLIPVEIADKNEISTDYEGTIQRALVYNIVKLDAKGRFNPKGLISRAEVAEEVYNALEYIKSLN